MVERKQGRRDWGKKRTGPDANELGIESFSALREYLQFKPQAIREIQADKRTAKEVLSLLKSHRQDALAAKIVTRDDSDRPLWVTLEIQPKSEDQAFKDWKTRSQDVILALDQVTDPRNLGAIVRSCGFFGVKEILFQEKRQVGITRASVMTAQGGFALVDAVIVTNLGRTLTDLKADGYWICGAAMDGEPVESVAGFYGKSVVVLGSEDRGLSSGIADKCDRFIGIQGSTPGVESLNVSVAAGILLDAWWRKRQKTDS